MYQHFNILASCSIPPWIKNRFGNPRMGKYFLDKQYNMFTLPFLHNFYFHLSLITPNHRCDTYGNNDMGWKFYPMLDDVKFIEASNWTYISVDFIRLFNLAFRFRFNIISSFIIYYFHFSFYLQPCFILFIIF